MTTYQTLLDVKARHGCGFLVLLDPDRKSPKILAEYVKTCEAAGVDGFLFGSSLLITNHFESNLKAVKKAATRPVIIFPGSSLMVSAYADAILYLSLISGRNPSFLINEHVKAAPIIKTLGLETIPTAYMLIESGVHTSVAYMSDTLPIPRDKSDIACVHALAGQYLGMKLVYLEAGSGAKEPVPLEMIKQVCEYIDAPVMVGGGICDAEYAGAVAKAGASFVVVGNTLEKNPGLVEDFVKNVHQR